MTLPTLSTMSRRARFLAAVTASATLAAIASVLLLDADVPLAAAMAVAGALISLLIALDA